MRRPPIAEHDSGDAEHPDEHHQPDADDGPVHVDPASGVHGADRAERGQRGQGDGHTARGERAEDHSSDHGDQPVPGDGHRAGPEAPQHLAILVAGGELAGDCLDPKDEAHQGGDRPEAAQRERLGLDGQLDLIHDARGDVEVVGRARRNEFDDLALHRGDAGPTRVELDAVEDRAVLARRDGDCPIEEGGTHVDKAVRPIDVVLDHLVVEDNNAGQRGPDRKARPDRRSAEARQFALGPGVEAQRHGLPDVHAENPRCGRGHHDLIGSPRIGEMALDRGEPVLVEEHAVDAAKHRHVPGRVEPGGAVRGERDDGRSDEVTDAATPGRWAILAVNGATGPPALGTYTETVRSRGCARENVGYDNWVRRPAVIEAMATPPVSPISTTTLR